MNMLYPSKVVKKAQLLQVCTEHQVLNNREQLIGSPGALFCGGQVKVEDVHRDVK